nr:syntaxin-81 [Quercus suber]
MSRVRDRTEDLKDAVRKTALSLEYSEVSTFIEACQEQIDIIKNSLNNEEANSKGWLGVRAVLDNTNADTIAHKYGVLDYFYHFVLILSERLHSITMQFDQLRAIRFQDAINRAMPRRKLHHNANSNSADTSKSNMSEFKEPDEFQPDHLRSASFINHGYVNREAVEVTKNVELVTG